LYRSFYGLKKRPFDNVPDPDFYFETAALKEASDILSFSVRQEGVISLLVGRNGCGKTLLLRKLLKEREDDCELAYVSGSQTTAEELLSEILYQLEGSPASNEGKDEQIRKLGTRLFEITSSGKKSLMVFDGVTGIARDDIMVELSKLLDLQFEDRSLAAFLIAGNSDIESAISNSRVRERVTVVARVKPLSLPESISYIDHRLKAAGAKKEIFTPEAKAAVGAAADGIPGQINGLADFSLFCGYRSKVLPVDIQTVDMAISRSLTDEIQGSSQEVRGTSTG
jgi:type II secretory pathway predicted ATPase ExeA